MRTTAQMKLEEQNQREQEIVREFLTNNDGFIQYNKTQRIVVVALIKDGTTLIGISKCGPGEKWDLELGADIALNRCNVKPDAIISYEVDSKQFDGIADFIYYHAGNNTQWNHICLPRIDRNDDSYKNVRPVSMEELA